MGTHVPGRRGSRPKSGSSSGLAARIWRNRHVQGYLYVGLWIVGFALFFIRPLIDLVAHSFTQFDLFTPPTPVGWDNYDRLFTNDPIFVQVVKNMVVYVFGATCVTMGLGLLFGVLLSRHFRFNHFFRVLLYAPSLLTGMATGVLFNQVFRNDENGLANVLLGQLGFSPVNWIQNYDQEWFALIALILVNVWFIGGTMIIFIAGINGINPAYYEAAAIDGAGPFRRFTSVTLPLLSPVILFNTVMVLVGHLQVFETPLIFSGGGGNAGSNTNTDILGYHYSLGFFLTYLYRLGWVNNRFGYASALAVVIFLVAMVLTAVVFWIGRKYTYYGQQLAEAG